MIGATAFDAPAKQWLVGIQDGVTQPKALERLGSVGESEVRVPFGAAAMADPGLRAPILFHPKLYYFENSSTERVDILSTSANLTLSALRSNVEQVLLWRGRRSDATAEESSEWWDAQWTDADPATAAFVAAYEAKRPKPPMRRPPTIAGPPDVELREASVFWVELTRKPEGGSFNQIELLFNGHCFFYPDTTEPPKAVPRTLSFEDRRGIVYHDEDRQIVFNGPPRMRKGNSMWRVYMPTLAMGFGGYQDSDALVRFERTGRPNHYLIEVAASRSPLALTWMDETSVAEYQGLPGRHMGWA